MDGAMIHTSAPASQEGTKAAYEKTNVWHWARRGCRNAHPSSVNALVRSEPM